MSDSTINGRFLWYDLLTTDEDAAVSFYSQIAGWGATPWEGGDMPYTMWTVGNGQFMAHLPACSGYQNCFAHLIKGFCVGKRGASLILVG